MNKSNSEAVAVRASAEIVAAPETGDMPPQILALYQQALDRGTEGVGALEKLMELQDRMQRRRAEMEFSLALGEFQSACPAVQKSSTAKIVTGSGGGYSFTYADLEEIISTVRPHLTAHGFSFTFDSKTDGKLLTCTCTLHHAHGHSMASSFTLPTDNKSGASEQQKVGGALTYAKRQCLISVLGLALTDVEPPAGAKAATISEDQVANLDALMGEVGVTAAQFGARFKLSALGELPAALYGEAVRSLEARRKAVSK